MSNNLTRKVERKKKKDSAKQIKKLVSMFSLLPEECSLCYKVFDKKSREDHLTWQVKVNETQREVFLSCPSCQEKNGEERA
tara:strand:+ start:8397 stop:8639 length:243 start_codon:yes stop_codon:yes gene_type:complete